MKISEEEFKKKLDAFIKEEYNKAKPKPNGMFGHMGFFKVKEREFKEKLKFLKNGSQGDPANV